MTQLKLLRSLSVMSIIFSMMCFTTQAHSTEHNIKQVCSDKSKFIKRRLSGEQLDNICEVYKSKVMLVVNTASKCGYTYQYDGLEKLYAKYKSRGLVVIGFPSNDFGAQEPANEKTIKAFCRLTYGVEFPMYAKTKIKGDDKDDFYKALEIASGESPKWNFHKYLLDRNGKLIGSYRSDVKPENQQLISVIEEAL